jgi:ABC-type dipeptide/oligopeptide/nickel transport system permease subunit
VLFIISSEFVEASRALGASRRWQLRTHVLPRLSQPLAVNLLGCAPPGTRSRS